MKKLMIAAAAAAMIGGAYAIESANIVGYNQLDFENGYKFLTPMFENVSVTNFNLSDIECFQADGTTWNDTKSTAKRCLGDIVVRKIDAEGAYGTQYRYYGSTTKDEAAMGWFVGTRATDYSNKVTGNSVTLAPGEGLIFYSAQKTGFLRFSGSVRLTELTTDFVNGYSFGGNNTPVTMNLSDIQCKQADGTDWNDTKSTAKRCLGDIVIRKIDAEGAYGTQYRYYGSTTRTENQMGWFVGTRADDFSNKVTGDAVTFAPGEGWIFYSAQKTGKLILPNAIK